jgi:2-polyprenyl-6-methoxyphenol hydroxylase-like FAD-dependent oxidoreductase
VQTIHQDGDGVVLEYRRFDGSINTLRSSWLIGSDGKRGFVRKQFLEKVADIRQVNSSYCYEGTWVASNLRISLPTPETHPDFPAWKAGLTPLEVYDLFWPKGWHFCSPPGKPTATGRFGPFEKGFWRHEFRQDDWDSTTMNAEELLWEHLTPMITRTECGRGNAFKCPAVYPRDCIEVLRCREFTFTQKVVNRWYAGKTVLIGDAAHTFSPFAGQGQRIAIIQLKMTDQYHCRYCQRHTRRTSACLAHRVD